MSIATLEPVQRLIADEMQAVDEVIRRRLYSDVVLVRQVAEYIISGGGKRLRPAVVLLALLVAWRATEPDPGLTTEVALVLAFALGVLAQQAPALAFAASHRGAADLMADEIILLLHRQRG